jgi:hypothetical protein
MSASRTSIAALCLAFSFPLAACNRRVEPYDPNEQVEQPDLSKIFPEGADRALARAPTEMPPAPEATGGAPAVAGMTAPENAGPPLEGTIRVAAGVSVPSGATLFVIARVGQAGPPTAVLRLPAPSFPLEFTLGPENRMMAGVPWQGPFQLTARIDLDGNAMTRDAGGLEGSASAPVSPGDTGIEIELGAGG